MFHTFQAIALYALLASCALALPARAHEPKREPASARGEGADEKKVPVDQDAIISVLKEELKKLETGLLKDLSGSVKGISTDVQGVKKSVAALQADLTNIKAQQLDLKAQLDSQKALIDQLTEDRKRLLINSSPAPSIDRASMDEIRNRFNAIENAIAKIPVTDKRLSMYGPTANGARVMLVNLYSDDVLFIVNGANHRVSPGRSKALENIPTGTVNMEVVSDRYGLISTQSTSLLSGETFTLTAFRR